MLKLEILAGRFAVCRLEPGAPLPAIPPAPELFCLVRTREELSLVCEESLAPETARVQTGWRALRVAGTLDFALTGVLSSLAAPLAREGISIFAVSTFDTDYLLVEDAKLSAALRALEEEGFSVRS